MKIGKIRRIGKTTAALLVIIALLAGALAYETLLSIENTMTVVSHTEVQLEVPMGVKITTYDWGDFDKDNPEKTVTFWLRSLSNEPLNVNITTSGLSPSFTVSFSPGELSFTAYNQAKNFTATLTLTDFSASPGAYGFNLEVWG